jgi:hypothetical protein
MNERETDTMTTDRTDLTLTLAPAPLARPNTLDMQAFGLIQLLAPSFHACRWYGLTSPEQAIVVMTKAVELGIPLTAAFDFFDVIEGRPTLKPVGALALIHRSALVEVVAIDSHPDRCTVTMRRRDTGFKHTATFTLQDAQTAGLIKTDKDGSAWKRYAQDMLRNRAIGRCARIVAPDVLAGLYLTSDLQDAETMPPPPANVDVVTGEILEATP